MPLLAWVAGSMLSPAQAGQAVRRDAKATPCGRLERPAASSTTDGSVSRGHRGGNLALGRLRTPLYREDRTQNFAPISWATRLNCHTTNSDLTAYQGAEFRIAMDQDNSIRSYYVAQKLLKGAIGTSNFDANSPLHEFGCCGIRPQPRL